MSHVSNKFQYHSKVTIWKDPVIEMQRTKAQGLLHKQIKKDSSISRQGLPDYLVVFRKWPENGETSGPIPIEHKKGFYVNPMFGGNIYLEYDECTVTILGKWEYPNGYVCPKCGYILKHNEWDHVCL